MVRKGGKYMVKGEGGERVVLHDNHHSAVTQLSE